MQKTGFFTQKKAAAALCIVLLMVAQQVSGVNLVIRCGVKFTLFNLPNLIMTIIVILGNM